MAITSATSRGGTYIPLAILSMLILVSMYSMHTGQMLELEKNTNELQQIKKTLGKYASSNNNNNPSSHTQEDAATNELLSSVYEKVSNLQGLIQGTQSNKQLEDIKDSLRSINVNLKESCPTSTPKEKETCASSSTTVDPNGRYLTVECAQGGGLNDCRMVIIEALYLGYLLNRTLIVPLIRRDVYSEPTLPFGSLFDVEYLNAHLGQMGHVIEKQNVPFPISPAAQVPFQVRKHIPAILDSITNLNHNKVLYFGHYHSFYGYRNIEEVNVYHEIAKGFRASKEIYTLVRDAVRQIRNQAESYACLHLRIEQDWQKFYKQWQYPLDALVVDNIVTRIRNHPVAKEIDALYIAGGNLSSTYVEPFQNAFKRIFTKNNFESPLIQRETSEVDTTKALIDFEICRAANIFIGNDHSLFTKNIDHFMRYENKPSLTYNVPDSDVVSPICNKEFHPIYSKKVCGEA